MDTFFVWMLVIGALTGAVFNSFGKLLVSYKIWVLTNFCLCILNFLKDEYAQAFLFFAYFLTSVNGWYNLNTKSTNYKACKTKGSRTHKKNEKLAKPKRDNSQ